MLKHQCFTTPASAKAPLALLNKKSCCHGPGGTNRASTCSDHTVNQDRSSHFMKAFFDTRKADVESDSNPTRPTPCYNETLLTSNLDLCVSKHSQSVDPTTDGTRQLGRRHRTVDPKGSGRGSHRAWNDTQRPPTKGKNCGGVRLDGSSALSGSLRSLKRQIHQAAAPSSGSGFLMIPSSTPRCQEPSPHPPSLSRVFLYCLPLKLTCLQGTLRRVLLLRSSKLESLLLVFGRRHLPLDVLQFDAHLSSPHS